MEVIVLQHIKIEDPGYIKDLMLKENCRLTTVELDEGETAESLAMASLIVKLVEKGKLGPEEADTFIEENI